MELECSISTHKSFLIAHNLSIKELAGCLKIKKRVSYIAFTFPKSSQNLGGNQCQLQRFSFYHAEEEGKKSQIWLLLTLGATN